MKFSPSTANCLLIFPLLRYSAAVVVSIRAHSGPVRALAVCPFTPYLVATGGEEGEVLLWDLRDLSKPYTPLGVPVTALPISSSNSNTVGGGALGITDIAWNRKVAHILATGTQQGNVTVWDLKNRKQLVTLPGHSSAAASVGALAWSPEAPTCLVVASEDDGSPTAAVWDLRNARAPEKTLKGHTRGILALSWSARDPELLLSAGKDGRILQWGNPQGASQQQQSIREPVAEVNTTVPTTTTTAARVNLEQHAWVTDLQWSPRHPDIFLASTLAGRVAIYSVQALGRNTEAAAVQGTPAGPVISGGTQSVSMAIGSGNPTATTSSPKWLRRPAGVALGWAGRLASFGQHVTEGGAGVQGTAVALGSLPSATTAAAVDTLCQPAAALVETVEEGVKACQDETQAAFARSRAILWEGKGDTCVFAWRAIAAVCEGRLQEALLEPTNGLITYEHVTSSVPSEHTSPVHDAKKLHSYDGEQRIEEDDEEDEEFDFARAINSHVPTTVNREQQHQQQLERRATFESLPFVLYSTSGVVLPSSCPSSPSVTDPDRRITRALVAGRYEEAVRECIAAGRPSDALLVAICGGPDLVAQTRRQYLQSPNSRPYLRLVSSIVKGECGDVVEWAELLEGGAWREVFQLVATTCSSNQQQGSSAGFQSYMQTLSDRLNTNTFSFSASNASQLSFLAASNRANRKKLAVQDDEAFKASLLAALGAGLHARTLQVLGAMSLCSQEAALEAVLMVLVLESKMSRQQSGIAVPLPPSLMRPFARCAWVIAEAGKPELAVKLVSRCLIVAPEEAKEGRNRQDHDQLNVLADRLGAWLQQGSNPLPPHLWNRFVLPVSVVAQQPPLITSAANVPSFAASPKTSAASSLHSASVPSAMSTAFASMSLGSTPNTSVPLPRPPSSIQQRPPLPTTSFMASGAPVSSVVGSGVALRVPPAPLNQSQYPPLPHEAPISHPPHPVSQPSLPPQSSIPCQSSSESSFHSSNMMMPPRPPQLQAHANSFSTPMSLPPAQETQTTSNVVTTLQPSIPLPHQRSTVNPQMHPPPLTHQVPSLPLTPVTSIHTGQITQHPSTTTMSNAPVPPSSQPSSMHFGQGVIHYGQSMQSASQSLPSQGLSLPAPPVVQHATQQGALTSPTALRPPQSSAFASPLPKPLQAPVPSMSPKSPHFPGSGMLTPGYNPAADAHLTSSQPPTPSSSSLMPPALNQQLPRTNVPGAPMTMQQQQTLLPLQPPITQFSQQAPGLQTQAFSSPASKPPGDALGPVPRKMPGYNDVPPSPSPLLSAGLRGSGAAAGGISNQPLDPQVIQSTLSGLIEKCAEKASPMQRRIIDDSARRIETLNGQMATPGALSPPTLALLSEMVRKVQVGDWNGAHALHTPLMSAHFSECGNWILAVKRLLEVARTL